MVCRVLEDERNFERITFFVGDESGSICLMAPESFENTVNIGDFVCIDGYCQSYGGQLRIVATSLQRPTDEQAEKIADAEQGWASAVGPRHPNALSRLRRSYGCLLIRGSRCVLTRSLEHPPRWPGLRIPHTPAEGESAQIHAGVMPLP